MYTYTYTCMHIELPRAVLVLVVWSGCRRGDLKTEGGSKVGSRLRRGSTIDTIITGLFSLEFKTKCKAQCDSIFHQCSNQVAHGG